MITAAQSTDEPSAAAAVQQMEQKIADTSYAWPSNLGTLMAPWSGKHDSKMLAPKSLQVRRAGQRRSSRRSRCSRRRVGGSAPFLTLLYDLYNKTRHWPARHS